MGVVALVSALESRPAHAEAPVPEVIEADDLFYQGKSLMEQGRVSAACQKLAESLAVRRRGGALLNLAVCRAKEGRYATALGLFEEALEVARKDGRVDRQQFARAQIEDARSKLSWLTIRLASPAVVAGLRIRRDGEELAPGDWGGPRAVDPGRHSVSAIIPGGKGFEITVVVEGPGDKKSVEIPRLAPDPPVAASPAPAPAPAPATGSAPNPAPQTEAAIAPPAASLSTAAAVAQVKARRRFAWTATGLGAAVLAVGLGFGTQALIDSDRTKKLCPGGSCPTDEGIQKSRDATREATVADVVVPIGAAAVAVGLYLLLSSRAPSAPSRAARAATTLRIVPVAGPGMAALSVGSAW